MESIKKEKKKITINILIYGLLWIHFMSNGTNIRTTLFFLYLNPNLHLCSAESSKSFSVPDSCSLESSAVARAGE